MAVVTFVRMKSISLIDPTLLEIILDRLCHQLIENHGDFSSCAIIGLQPRGVLFSNRIVEKLKELQPSVQLKYGIVDPTFYRDDFRRSDKTLLASPTEIPFSLEGLDVVLIDDVLYTGRTIRAGMEGLMEYGRPKKIELMVLVDRRFSRELPIEASYIGKSVDSYDNQKVKVSWAQEGGKDQVILITE